MAHFYSSVEFMKKFSNLTSDFDQIDEKAIFLKVLKKHRGQKTIVFDLDETLVHCN
jgi:predicted HAD superfamily phosphohydrolase YqeG